MNNRAEPLGKEDAACKAQIEAATAVFFIAFNEVFADNRGGQHTMTREEAAQHPAFDRIVGALTAWKAGFNAKSRKDDPYAEDRLQHNYRGISTWVNSTLRALWLETHTRPTFQESNGAGILVEKYLASSASIHRNPTRTAEEKIIKEAELRIAMEIIADLLHVKDEFCSKLAEQVQAHDRDGPELSMHPKTAAEELERAWTIVTIAAKEAFPDARIDPDPITLSPTERACCDSIRGALECWRCKTEEKESPREVRHEIANLLTGTYGLISNDWPKQLKKQRITHFPDNVARASFLADRSDSEQLTIEKIRNAGNRGQKAAEHAMMMAAIAEAMGVSQEFIAVQSQRARAGDTHRR